jgi:hypothetical protein
VLDQEEERWYTCVFLEEISVWRHPGVSLQVQRLVVGGARLPITQGYLVVFLLRPIWLVCGFVKIVCPWQWKGVLNDD